MTSQNLPLGPQDLPSGHLWAPKGPRVTKKWQKKHKRATITCQVRDPALPNGHRTPKIMENGEKTCAGLQKSQKMSGFSAQKKQVLKGNGNVRTPVTSGLWPLAWPRRGARSVNNLWRGERRVPIVPAVPGEGEGLFVRWSCRRTVENNPENASR